MNIATRSTNRWTLLTLFTLLLMVGVGGSQVWGQGDNRHTTWTQITKSVTGKPGDNVEVAVKVTLVPVLTVLLAGEIETVKSFRTCFGE